MDLNRRLGWWRNLKSYISTNLDAAAPEWAEPVRGFIDQPADATLLANLYSVFSAKTDYAFAMWVVIYHAIPVEQRPAWVSRLFVAVDEPWQVLKYFFWMGDPGTQEILEVVITRNPDRGGSQIAALISALPSHAWTDSYVACTHALAYLVEIGRMDLSQIPILVFENVVQPSLKSGANANDLFTETTNSAHPVVLSHLLTAILTSQSPFDELSLGQDVQRAWVVLAIKLLIFYSQGWVGQAVLAQLSVRCETSVISDDTYLICSEHIVQVEDWNLVWANHLAFYYLWRMWQNKYQHGMVGTSEALKNPLICAYLIKMGNEKANTLLRIMLDGMNQYEPFADRTEWMRRLLPLLTDDLSCYTDDVRTVLKRLAKEYRVA